jgi:hypothetical protein
MVSVAIWLVSGRSQLTHALLMFADLGANNDFTPDECGAMQCVLGFACPTAENVTEGYRGLEAPQKTGVARLFVFPDMQNEESGGGEILE